MKFHAAGWAAVAIAAFLLAGCEPDTIWSPDSKMLALDPHGVLFTYDLGSRKFQQRTTGPEQALNPSWSPDGKRLIYYGATVDKQSEVKALRLMTLDVSTGKAIPLPTAVSAPKAPAKPEEFRIDVSGRLDLVREVLNAAWSPNGKRLAFIGYTGTQTSLWLADASGAGAKVVATLGKEAVRPVWSPDSSRLAYLTQPHEDGAPPANDAIAAGPAKYRLEVVQADGAGARVLWDDKQPETLSPLGPRPEWSTDGASLLVDTDVPRDPAQMPMPEGPPDRGKLWSLPLEGAPKLLAELPGPTPFATFNGGRIAFFRAPKSKEEKQPFLMTMAPPYTEPKGLLQVTDAMLGIKPGKEPEVDAFPVPTLSPDGKLISLVFAQKSGLTKLVLFPTDGSKPSSLDVPIKLPAATGKVNGPPKKPAPRAPKSKK